MYNNYFLYHYFFIFFFFFCNDTTTTEIYTLSLHDALPIRDRPPSGEGARTASAPPSRASKPAARTSSEGATSPPTRIACPPRAAARRAASSSLAPRQPPRCAIQSGSGAPARYSRQAARSSGGVARTSRAPVRRAASRQPRANCPKSHAASCDRKPLRRASSTGSRAKRTTYRRICLILRRAGGVGSLYLARINR